MIRWIRALGRWWKSWRVTMKFQAACYVIVKERGFEAAVRTAIDTGRSVLEKNPEGLGVILAHGVRDPGTIAYAALAAARRFEELGGKLLVPARPEFGAIPALVFSTIAYNQAYFDGNKRTGFLSGVVVGAMLGFRIRQVPYHGLEDEIKGFSARDAPIAEVASWFLEKVLILPGAR